MPAIELPLLPSLLAACPVLVVVIENRIRAGADAAMNYPRFGMIDLLKLLSGLPLGTARQRYSAGWRGIDASCASLPTRSPTPAPDTRGKSRLLD